MFSVIIPTHNRVNQLEKCIEFLDKQTMQIENFEIIIVDDGSSDGTAELGKSLQESGDFHIKYLFQKNKGPATARNLGICQARGEIILFLDDDCRAKEKWLEELVKGYEDPQVGGTGGRIISPLRGTLADRYCSHVGLLETPKIKGNRVEYVITANASFRKSVLEEVGGFDENYEFPGGEDPDLCLRVIHAGHKLLFNSNAMVSHHHPRSLSSLRKTYFNYGMGEALLIIKKKKGVPVLILQFFYLFLSVIYAVKKVPAYVFKTRSWEGFAFAFFDVYIRTAFRVGLIKGYFRYRRMY